MICNNPWIIDDFLVFGYTMLPMPPLAHALSYWVTMVVMHNDYWKKDYDSSYLDEVVVNQTWPEEAQAQSSWPLEPQDSGLQDLEQQDWELQDWEPQDWEPQDQDQE